MAFTPEEQNAINREADKAALAAAKAVEAAQIAMNKPTKAPHPAYAAPKPTAHATPRGSLASIIASLSLEEESPAPKAPPTELEKSIAAIARASNRSPERGEAELLNQLKRNPELMAKLGAHAANKDKPQTLGNLDLDGHGYSRLEGAAIAATIGAMQANRSNADIANSLGTKGFRDRATAIMSEMADSIQPANKPTELAENTCKPSPLRIIPCPKGGNSR